MVWSSARRENHCIPICRFISLTFLSISVASNILSLYQLFCYFENFMFLFGRFRFWAPICFPEIISSRYDPKFERLLEANWRKAAQRTFRIFDYFTAYNTVFPPNILVRKFCGKAQFPHSFGGLAQNYAETVPLYKTSIPGNQVKSRYFTKFLLGSFRIMVYQEIGTLKEKKRCKNVMRQYTRQKENTCCWSPFLKMLQALMEDCYF